MPRASQHCTTCGGEREFEQPPCMDGHGGDCPEWLCVVCGHAIVVDFDVEYETIETVGWAA